jgi:hypothetical protein
VANVCAEQEGAMIDTLRSLIVSLEKLPESYQKEAVRRIEPIVDELVDRRWDEQLAKIPEDAWDRLDEQLAQDRAAGRFQPMISSECESCE